MPQIINFVLYGKITSVTPNGNFAVVTLDRPSIVLSKIYRMAVINEETINRVQFMSRNPSGRLTKGLEVKITSFRTDPELLQVLKLAA